MTQIETFGELIKVESKITACPAYTGTPQHHLGRQPAFFGRQAGGLLQSESFVSFYFLGCGRQLGGYIALASR
ncbi:MAG: hypothetical protein ACXIUQ_03015 [Cecembia sp.]